MSAVIVSMERRPTTLPDVVARKVAAFLAAGTTGTIEIQVHQGIVRGAKITESFRCDDIDVNSGHIDDKRPMRQDSGR